MEPQELIQKTRDFLADPKHWTKGAYGRDKGNHQLPQTLVEKAVSCCLIGALIRFSNGGEEPYGRAYHTIRALVQGKGFDGILNFNDASETTHEDVLAILDEAKELA